MRLLGAIGGLLLIPVLVVVGPFMALAIAAWVVIMALWGLVSWLPQAPRDISRWFGKLSARFSPDSL